MKALHPHSLARLFEGYGVPAPKLKVSGLQLDSRRVAPGDLFLAVRGSGGHGLAHLEQAVSRGAAAVAWEPAPGIAAPDAGIPQLAVPGLGQRVGEIAARYYEHPTAKLFVSGVTGTDGKTSTAHLIAQALDLLGEPCAYLGTLGYGRLGALQDATHTTPDPISLQKLFAGFVQSGCRAASIEVSSHALDQARVAGIAFDAAVLTNVMRDHLDYHGTVEAYAAAKRKLFETEDTRALILNRDDATGAAWLQEFSRLTSHASRLTAYGLDGDAPTQGRHVLGRKLELHGAGLRLDIETSWGTAKLDSQLLGRFNAYNLLAALAVLLNKGHALMDAVAALAQARTVPGRIEGFRGPAAAPLVVVDYAHTPQALEAILKAVRAHTAGQLWCVFGCGGDRDRGKRPLMGAAAAKFADRLIVTDDNPRGESPQAIVAEILAGIPHLTPHASPLTVEHDRAAAITAAVRGAAREDVVVVAGKGHEDYQIYGSDRRDFSDRAYVAQLVGVAAR